MVIEQTFATADEVAVTVVAAARETRANPMSVVEGLGPTYDQGASRARVYAAIALRTICPKSTTNISIGRAVGSGSPDVYVSIIMGQTKRKELKWFDPQILSRVIRILMEFQRTQIVPIVMTPRFAENGYISADRRSLLYDAVRNTLPAAPD